MSDVFDWPDPDLGACLCDHESPPPWPEDSFFCVTSAVFPALASPPVALALPPLPPVASPLVALVFPPFADAALAVIVLATAAAILAGVGVPLGGPPDHDRVAVADLGVAGVGVAAVPAGRLALATRGGVVALGDLRVVRLRALARAAAFCCVASAVFPACASPPVALALPPLPPVASPLVAVVFPP